MNFTDKTLDVYPAYNSSLDEYEHREYGDEYRQTSLKSPPLIPLFEQTTRSINFITCPNCNTSIQLSFMSDNQCLFCFFNIPGELFNEENRKKVPKQIKCLRSKAY